MPVVTTCSGRGRERASDRAGCTPSLRITYAFEEEVVEDTGDGGGMGVAVGAVRVELGAQLDELDVPRRHHPHPGQGVVVRRHGQSVVVHHGRVGLQHGGCWLAPWCRDGLSPPSVALADLDAAVDAAVPDADALGGVQAEHLGALDDDGDDGGVVADELGGGLVAHEGVPHPQHAVRPARRNHVRL